MSLPDSSGRHIIFGLNCPCKSWHGGWNEVERGEDLLVLLPHVHNHPRLGRRKHFPPFPRLLSAVVAKDGDTRGDCSGLRRRGSESQGRSVGDCCRRSGARRSRCVQHWRPRQVHHRVELASLLGRVLSIIIFYYISTTRIHYVVSTWHW